MSTDRVDGRIARSRGRTSELGSPLDPVARWALLVALVLTWISGLDYARVAPGLLRGRAVGLIVGVEILRDAFRAPAAPIRER